MMALIRARGEQAGLGYRIYHPADRRNRTSQHPEQLQKRGRAFQTVIEIDASRVSPIAGLPITRYRPGARGSQQYRELAQELIEHVKEKSQQTA
jgi:cellulose biosynthesis protein BcsQ